MRLTKHMIAGIISLFLTLIAVIIYLSLKVLEVSGFFHVVRTENVIMAELSVAVDACKAEFDNNNTLIKMFKNFSCREAAEVSAFMSWTPRLDDDAAAIRLFKFALLSYELYLMQTGKCIYLYNSKYLGQLSADTDRLYSTLQTLRNLVLARFGLEKFENIDPKYFFLKLDPQELIQSARGKEQKEVAKLYVTIYNHILEDYEYVEKEFSKMCDEKTQRVLKAL